MKFLRRTWSRLTGNLARGRREAELAEEFESHVEMLVEENLRRGMTPEEARRAALIKFGGIESAKENYRDQRCYPWIETFLQDVRYALRGMRRSPGFTAVAVICLALGIGANTAIFSVINAIMIRLLPVSRPEQLVLLNFEAKGNVRSVQTSMSGYKNSSFPYAVFESLRERVRTMSGVAAFVPTGFGSDSLTVVTNGRSGLATGELVSGNYFSLLGVSPAIGRAIVEDDLKSGAPNVAVISHSYWKREFGGAPSVIGQYIDVNGLPFTIVGVAPAEFLGLNTDLPPDIWAPLRDMPALQPWGLRRPAGKSVFPDKRWWWCMIVGRLKPDTSKEQVLSEANALFQNTIAATATSLPPANALPRLVLISASRGMVNLRKRLSQPLFVLSAVMLLVLLIACTNVAALLVARAKSRQREICVRLAIGASRARIVRQLLTESTLLSLIGGGLGLLVAQWGSRVLVLLLPAAQGTAEIVSSVVRLDGTVLFFSLVVSVVTGFVFGLAPALRATRVNLASQLHECSSTTASRFALGRLLVSGQVALSVLLLFGAGLFVRTLQNLEQIDVGFNSNNLLLFRVDPSRTGYDDARASVLYRRALERIKGVPGVQSASISSLPLLAGWKNTTNGYPDSGTVLSDSARLVSWNHVSPGFLETMGIPVLFGRNIEWRDFDGGRRVAVVNETLAQRFFPNESPVGHRLTLGIRYDPSDSWEIVGVARNAKYSDIRQQPPCTAYLLFEVESGRIGSGGVHFEIRTAGDPAAMASSIRKVMRDVDPSLPLIRLRTQRDVVDEALQLERMFASLTTLFGLLALLLVSIGLYGTLTYSVVRRTSEIGIRMALGAERPQVMWMILRESLSVTGVGLAVGLPLAISLSRLVRSQLYDVTPYDPVTIAMTAVILAVVTVVAGFVPANRASRIEPMQALRCE
ncbi:MAG: ABC transporter permease [Bryobacteraceae bacterium]